jgi:hypothetical protein
MTKKRMASRTEIVAIHAELVKVVRKLEGGLCEYVEGHSDATVAAIVGCTDANVSGVRSEMFGKLRRPATSDEAARHELMVLRRSHDDLKVRFDILVSSLSLNKVLDVRHLHTSKPLDLHTKPPEGKR